MMTNKGRIKVLYIAGSGRSGSTILHNVLGQIEGYQCVGELRHIWERGVSRNRLCGCGCPFRQCGVWQAIMRAAFGGMDPVHAEAMFGLAKTIGMNDLPRMSIPRIRDRPLSRLRGYMRDLEALYQAIHTVTGSSVIVDSSKNPAYAYILRMIPTIDLYILHIVRPSRAVAHSWSRKKLFEPGDSMTRQGPLKSGLQWSSRNVTAEVWLRAVPERYARIRYEDFVASPATSIRDVLNLLGAAAVKMPFISGDTVDLKANHSVFGNEVRFQTGPVKLTLDGVWQREMPKSQRLAVTGLTWPLLLRYGYV